MCMDVCDRYMRTQSIDFNRPSRVNNGFQSSDLAYTLTRHVLTYMLDNFSNDCIP